MNLYDIEDLFSIFEFIIGVLCYHRMRSEYKMLFFNTMVSLSHLLIFRFLLEFMNPVSINLEWYSITLFYGSFQLMFLLISKNAKNINHKISFFIGVLIFGIIVEIICVGIDSYRISLVETFVDFYLIIISINVLVEKMKNIHLENKVILYLLPAQIQLLIIVIIYNITLLFTFHHNSDIWGNVLGYTMLISYIINSIFTSIAYLWLHKKERFLELS